MMMECSAVQQRCANSTSRISHHHHHHLSSVPSTSTSFKVHQNRHRARSAFLFCRMATTPAATTTRAHTHNNHAMQQFGKSCMHRAERDVCVISKRKQHPFASFSL